MSGTITHLSGSGDTRKTIRNDSQEPLKIFTDAKMRMRDIFNNLEECVVEMFNFYTDGEEPKKFVPERAVAEVKRFKESIAAIQEMCNRDKMKVVVFGRTSNGKSTVINAMLHSKILPQGMGHTTACFLQVEGGGENERYFTMEGQDKKEPISRLNDLGHALSSSNSNTTTMGTDKLVNVFYPKANSKLLQNEVVIVDSPGVDLSPEFDTWIDKHCLDADVFVLVLNSESTLTQAEKKFFNRVSKKLSRPNIFILNNRWDASSGETEHDVEMVRSQHIKQFTHFLVDELKCCTKKECEERMFFVSAREILESRLKAKGETKNAYRQDGYEKREKEFLNFEKSFEKCISKSAIRTKFEAHSRRANEIVNDMKENLSDVTNLANREKQRLKLDYELKNKEFRDCRKNYAEFEQRYREQQQRIRQEVNLKVSADFHEEIERLESVIDRFNEIFNDDPHSIQIFKKKLAEYVDKCVTESLEAKCSGGLMSRIWQLENELYQNIADIIGSEYMKELESAWRYKHPFKFTITINVPELVADFHEDLEFRFSLGIQSIIRKLVAYKTGRPVTSIGREQFAVALNQPNQGEFDDEVANMIYKAALMVANGGVGAAVIGVMIYQNIGWKIIAGGATIYGGLYLLERLRWNSAAKEQHLKDQFRSHLSLKMKQVGNVHTAQCEAQVMTELEGVHNGLRDVVGGVHQQMKSNLDSIKKGIDQVEEFLKGITSIKNKSSFLMASLETFATKFLAPGSP